MAKQGQTTDQGQTTNQGATNQGLEGLTAAAKLAADDAARTNTTGKTLPPVHLWNPPFCGDLDMRIASDGTWFYMGTPIGRPALVRLFSTILKREGDKHFLVTPVEKVGIRVDDAPFLAVEMQKERAGKDRLLRFRTNVDDWVTCDTDHRGRWSRDVRGDIGGGLFSDGGCGAGEGRALTDSMVRAEPARIGSAEFFDRARARLRFDVPPGLVDPNIIPESGDPGTDRMLEIIAREQPIRPAAVLIPVVEHREPTVLLTQRAGHLADHAGQIAFPGGKIDATDASPLDAALREAWEEIGLDRAFVDPIGYLDLYGTGFGFRILPTVARVRPGFTLNINHSEVDDAFEVPLAFLMNPVNHQIHSKEFRGMERTYYAMPYAERYIWGATAGILRILYERICQS